MDRILRIDMGAPGGPKASIEALGRYAGLGGRAMAAALVVNEVPPDCHPLGPENKLVLAPGLMSGSTSFPGRLSIGCKSPLTGGILEAGAGGTGGQALARLGYAALVIEGEHKSDDLYQLLVTAQGVAVTPANECRMLSNYDLAEKVAARSDGHASMISIGAAGEMRMSTSTISATDAAFRPARPTGRGGAGAVLGAKGLKLIVIDPAGTRLCQPADAKAFAAASRKLADLGPRAEARAAHEAAWSHGGACGVNDPDTLARLDFLGDHYGLDSAELGVTIGLAMQAGVVPFGDGEGAIGLVHEVGRGTPLGRILGAGSATTARCFGLGRAPADAGQARPVHAGFDVAQAALGADHGTGYAVAARVLGVGGDGPRWPLNQAERTHNLQVATAALEAIGHGPSEAFAILDRPETLQALVEAINAMFDLCLTADDVVALGRKVLAMEREFNAKAGFARTRDRLPRYFSREPLASHGVAFDLPAQELDNVYHF